VRIYDEHNAAGGRLFGRLLLGVALVAHGSLTEALDVLSAAEALGSDPMSGDITTLAMVRLLLAKVRFERNELEAAAALCDSALPQVEHAEGSIDLFQSGYWIASGVRLARGDFDDALRTIERGLLTAARRGLKRLRRVLEQRRLEILMRYDKLALPSLSTAVELFHREEAEMSFLEREVTTMTLARLSIVAGQPGVAVTILEPWLGVCEEYGRGLTRTRLQILLALAKRQCGQPEQAAQALRSALTLAAPERAIRAFLDEGSEAFELLDDALRHIGITHLEPDEVRLLIDVFSARPPPADHQDSDVGKIFKAREREVLVGLRDDLSNKMIARRLGLTDHAVRYHLKRIYAKLGVTDRTMAVAVARRHGLIHDPPPRDGDSEFEDHAGTRRPGNTGEHGVG
jgi:LuxR family maltose regulon positive regulatory protein